MKNTTMPTYEPEERFLRDWKRLTEEERDRFTIAPRKFVFDLKQGRGFRKSLRVKGVQKRKDVYEMTWADNGRATFAYGTSPNTGDVHIIWRRIGGHEILDEP